jgi:hypothetical protein
MRLLLMLLIAANALLYAYQDGDLGQGVAEGHDPARLADQIDPDKIRLISVPGTSSPIASAGSSGSAAGGAGGTSGAPSAATAQAEPKAMACVEFGGFNPDEAKRVEPILASLNLGSRLSQRHLDDQATFIVYLPPFKTKADADHAAAELRRIGISDFFVIQDAGPYHLAISLGIFHNEDAAKGLLTNLSQQGVKNAKTGERPSTISKTYYQMRPGDPALLLRLNDIRSQFPNQDVHECAASGVTAAAGAASSLDKVATSSSGT